MQTKGERPKNPKKIVDVKCVCSLIDLSLFDFTVSDGAHVSR